MLQNRSTTANVYFFLFLLILSGVGVFLLFRPFLTAIVVGGVLATLLYGMYKMFRKALFGNQGVAALLVCLFALIVVVTPVSVLLGFAVNEANAFIHSEQAARLLDDAGHFVENLPFIDGTLDGEGATGSISDSLGSAGSGTIGFIGAAYQGVSGIVIWLFMMIFSLFYFLIDGSRFLSQFSRFSPFHESQDRLIFQKFVSISRAMVKGTLVVALVQGALGGIAFWIVGISSPVLWAILMSVASLVPMLGAGLVWFPTGLYLLLTGNIWQGVFMLAFGALVISLIDNILRPKLVGRDTEMHPLLVLFATIGGISLFGVSGILIGPIIISIFLVLAEIYAHEYGSGGTGDGDPSTIE